MLSWIKNKIGKGEERALTYSTGLSVGLIQQPGYSGMPVTEQTALGIASILCGVRVISEAVGSLPPVVYSRNGKRRDRADDHPLSHLLANEPNPECTRPVLFETAQAHALLYGNAFLEIERDNAGRPVALWNVHPQYVQVGRDSSTGRLVYRVQNSQSGGPPGLPGESQVLDAADMIHVPGLTPDGSVGYRLLTIARDAIGFGLAAQRYGCSLFRNLGRPGGVINVPPGMKLDESGRENLKKSFRGEHGGENVGTVALMEQGITFAPMTMATNEQTQYKDLLQFFVYEVARLLNVQPSKLHSLEKATWANLESLNADFLTTTLRPWLEKWEAELERKLLVPTEKGKLYVEFDTSCLLRVDQATRYTSYATASGGASWLTADEIRERENLPPLDKPAELDQEQPGQPAEDKPADQSTEGKPKEGADVQGTAMNGSQIVSLLQIATALANKQLPPEAVSAILKAAFPAVDAGLIGQIVSSLAAFTPPEPEPAPAPQLDPHQGDNLDQPTDDQNDNPGGKDA